MKDATTTMTLKELRKSKGLSQREIAEKAGIGRSKFARLERGGALRKLDSYVKGLGGTLEVSLTFPGEKRVLLVLDKPSEAAAE